MIAVLVRRARRSVPPFHCTRTPTRGKKTLGKDGNAFEVKFDLFAIPKAYPFTTQLVISTVKSASADVIVQSTVEGKSFDSINWRRTFAFGAFGFAFLGALQYAIYVPMYRRVFKEMDRFCAQTVREKLRNRRGLKQLAGQIFIGQCVMQPLTYYPVFYIFKESVMGEKNYIEHDPTVGEISRSALRKYKRNFWVDNLSMLAFWLPADVIIYSVPIWARMPLSHCISFMWCAILSWFRGAKLKREKTKRETEGKD